MSLNGIYARPSASTFSVELVHRESGKVVETLPIRPAQEQHRAFILATWVRSYAATARKMLTRAVYVAGEPKIAERLWPKAMVITSPDDDYTVHGWICAEEGKLYHMYIIPELRRKGIAGALIQLAVGPKVEYARPWPYEPPRHWNFNPYLLVE